MEEKTKSTTVIATRKRCTKIQICKLVVACPHLSGELICLARLLCRDEGLLSPDPTLDSRLDGESPKLGHKHFGDMKHTNSVILLNWTFVDFKLKLINYVALKSIMRPDSLQINRLGFFFKGAVRQ